jgi:hypothetical protein
MDCNMGRYPRGAGGGQPVKSLSAASIYELNTFTTTNKTAHLMDVTEHQWYQKDYVRTCYFQNLAECSN